MRRETRGVNYNNLTRIRCTNNYNEKNKNKIIKSYTPEKLLLERMHAQLMERLMNLQHLCPSTKFIWLQLRSLG